MTTHIYPTSGEVRNPGANWQKSCMLENRPNAPRFPESLSYPEVARHG